MSPMTHPDLRAMTLPQIVQAIGSGTVTLEDAYRELNKRKAENDAHGLDVDFLPVVGK